MVEGFDTEILHGQSLRKKDESDTMLSPSLRLLRSRACRGAVGRRCNFYNSRSADSATLKYFSYFCGK